MPGSVEPGQTTTEQRASRRLDGRTLAVAVLVPASFFLALELLLALSGVRPALYEQDPYVGFVSKVPLFVDSNEVGTLTTARNKRRLFNAQSFAASKPQETYRIFCIGGSTTYGRPYDDATSFCGWLRQLLPAIDSSRRWEVVNAGGVSYASYRSALVMEELNRYQPDLYIIYSGHNEFLERRTYSGLIATPPAIRGLAASASRTRIYSAMRLGLHALRSPPDRDGDQPTRLAEEVETLLDGSIGPDAYERDDALRSQVLAHYRFNLARMVDIAHAAGAAAILVTPASNLRDSSPFKSQHRANLAPAELARWQQLYERAEQNWRQGEVEASRVALEASLDIDDRYAGAHYLHGRLLLARRETQEAAAAFARARDEDVCPLRALAPAAALVREVALARDTPYVDFARWAESQAPDGIPGDDLFLDHVHPTISTHRQLALELVAAMRDAGIVAATASWNAELVARITERVETTIDDRQHGRALLNLSKVLGWAGKLEEAGRLAVKAVGIAPELAEAHYQAGLTAQLNHQLEEAIGHYRRALELAPEVATAHGNLAAALEESGSTLQAILHYRRAIALLGTDASPYRQQLVATLERLGATPDG